MRVELDSGEIVALGTVETAPTISITDYSRRETDEFGVTKVTKRGFARRMSVRLSLPTSSVDNVQRRLADLRATAALWVADERFASLSVRGFYKEFAIDVAYPPQSFATLTVESLASPDVPADTGADPAPDGRASTLRVIPPVQVTDAMLVSSSIGENEHPQWSATATYAAGARVIKVATHRIYESVTGGNVGNDPAGTSGKWLDVGPTNRWAMFDQALGTVTSRSGPVNVTIAPGQTINAVAVLDIVGAQVRVQAPGFDQTKTTAAPEGGKRTALLFSLPPTAGNVIVTTTGVGTVSVGTLILGQALGLGITEQSPTAGITDYSRKDVDDFGEQTIIERAWAKRMAVRSLIRSDAVELVQNRIASVRGQPSLWIGSDALDTLTVYGFFKDFSAVLGENVSTVSLSIEGLSAAAKVGPLSLVTDWADLTDRTGTKPQPNATDGAVLDPTAPYGTLRDFAGQPFYPEELRNADLSLSPSGRLTALVRGLAGNLETKELGLLNPIDLGAASAGAQRQFDGALEKLAIAVTRATTDTAAIRQIMRDAGISIDPASGKVSIYATEQLDAVAITLDAQAKRLALTATSTQVDEKILAAILDPAQVAQLEGIYAQIDQLGIDLDAAEGTISLKADTTALTALGARVTSAEEVIQSLPDGALIRQEVTAARYAYDKTAEATLRAILTGDRTSLLTQQAIAAGRQELSARILENEAAEAKQRLELGVQIGAVRATATQETLARIEADQAISGRIDDFVISTDEGIAAANSAIGVQSTNLGKVAGSVASLTTTVGDHTASLTTYGQSIDGLNAKWGVEMDIGGRVSGLALNGTGQRTDFVVRVDRFYLSRPGAPSSEAPFAVFDVTGGIFYLNGKLKAQSIDTPMFNGRVVTRRAAVDLGSQVAGAGGGLGDVLTFMLDLPYAADVIVQFIGSQTYSGSPVPDWGADIIVNGQTRSVQGGGAGIYSSGFALACKVSLPANPAGQPQTVTARWSGGNGNITLKNATLIVDGAFA
jgi:hypothetical protein